MPEFLKMLTTSLLQLNSGITTPVELKNIASPSNNDVKNTLYGNIGFAEYIAMAESINSSMNSTGNTPDSQSSSLGDIGYKTLVYMYSKILSFYGENNRLPDYVTVDSYITNPEAIPSELQQYLQSTAN